MRRHLAELNIAKPRYALDDPRIADFMNALDRVNAIAERSEGFVWRLKDEAGNATAIGGFDDPAIIPNLSVWESAEHLERFVWLTVHKQFYGRRGEWFESREAPHFVMWWVEAGHQPSLAEARERLEYLTAHGPSEHAFGWESLPNIKLWLSQRCA